MRKAQPVTDRELDILKVLWARGKCSVREVQEELAKNEEPVAYSTVQTLLNIMEDKKDLVGHEVIGRSFVYYPKKAPENTVRDMTQRFVDRVFDGALDRMMTALLESRPPSANELERLHAMINDARKQSQPPQPPAHPAPGNSHHAAASDDEHYC